MYDIADAMSHFFTPGAKEQTTLRDTKFNYANHHPMAKSSIDETIFFTYMEDVEECYGHTIMEFEENATLSCQNKTVMSERRSRNG